MSDNLRRFQAVRSRLIKEYPGTPSKRRTRHLSTLAGLVAGIVAAGSTHLSKVAQKAPDQTKNESRAKRFSRFINNKRITIEAFFMPYAEALVATLSQHQPLLVVFDSSAIGRGCATLMASVVYDGRALPVAWLTKRGKKGHFSAEDHIMLLNRVRALVPDRAEVILLGDGEFDSVELQEALDEARWHYVCRTSLSKPLMIWRPSAHFMSGLRLRMLRLSWSGFTSRLLYWSRILVWGGKFQRLTTTWCAS